MIVDYVRYSVRSLFQRKTRSWLTIIGIFVGIAAVVSLISLSSGMQQAVNAQFEKLGSNRITVSPGQSQFGPAASAFTSSVIAEGDLDVVKKAKGIDVAGGVLSESGSIEFSGHKKTALVWGTPTDAESLGYMKTISFFEVFSGRDLRPGDRYVAVAGYNVANDLFDRKMRVNDRILVEGVEFTVVGLQKKAGTGIHDRIIRIPLNVEREIFSEPDKLSSVFAKVKDGADVNSVVEGVKKDLRKYRGVNAGEEDFSVQTAQQVIGAFNSILLMVQVVLIGIAAISLVVGGVGIMNTMYASVLERRKEIGVMKSVGARNSDVMLIFLFESGILGAVGGIVGIAIGLLISNGAAVAINASGIAEFSALNSPQLVFGALLFAFGIGSLSGILPALQAARLKPVEALKK